MSRVASVVRMHIKAKSYWLSLPWGILLLSFSVNLIISIIAGEKVAIYTGGQFCIYIYLFAMGIIVLNETFPFALGFSVRRTDYFLGTIIVAVVICICSAALFFLLAFIENRLTGGWFVQLNFFHLPYLSDGPQFNLFWVPFTLMMFMYTLGLAIGCIYQRIGRNGLLVLGAFALALATVISFACSYFNWWVEIFHWFIIHSAFDISLWLVLFIVVFMFIAYILLRKAIVR